VSLLAGLIGAALLMTPAAPPAAGVADYQLGGAYRPAANVQIVVRDRTEKPAPDVYSVCYVNAFQTQPGTVSWWKKHHPQLLLRDRTGRVVRDPGWPDEILLDIRTSAKRAELLRTARAWFAGCARDGYAAVEPDNLDAWTRSRRLLTRAQTVDLARDLVAAAHDAGLAIAQKNTAELSTTRIGFDFAVAEECDVYRECDAYTRRYGDRVIEIEYADHGRAVFNRACASRRGHASIVFRDRDVVPRGAKGYLYRTC
jgi:hypothetical protein